MTNAHPHPTSHHVIGFSCGQRKHLDRVCLYWQTSHGVSDSLSSSVMAEAV